MKIKILTVGSRGDVQPYVALAKGLLAKKHEVTLCTERGFEEFVTKNGVPFAPVRAEYIHLAQSEEGKKIIKNPLNVFKILKTVIYPMMSNMLDDFWKHCQDADLILYHPKSLAASHIAEKLAIPIIAVMPVPMLTPTTAFPSPIIKKNLGAFLNKLSYVINKLAFASAAKPINFWRKEVLNLPKRKSNRIDYLLDGALIPVIYAHSPNFLPKPKDWSENIATTGYLFLDDDLSNWQAKKELVNFLDTNKQNEQIVCITFGSMPIKNEIQFAKILTKGVLQSGKKAIIVKGWGQLPIKNVEHKILVIPPTPFSWLFPKVDMVMHHGGAGVTSESLRAGKPMMICPFGLDQYFWGNEAYNRGVARKPIAQNKLTVNNLANAIKETLINPLYAQKAKVIGEKITAEDGIEDAINFIEKKIHGHKNEIL